MVSDLGEDDADEGFKCDAEFDLKDISVPLGVKINDPVRMYLKKSVVLIY